MAAKWSTGFAGGAPGNRRVDVQQAAEEERLNNVEPKIKHTVYCISKTYMAQIPKLYQYIARISVSMCISVSIIEPNLRHFDCRFFVE